MTPEYDSPPATEPEATSVGEPDGVNTDRATTDPYVERTKSIEPSPDSTDEDYTQIVPSAVIEVAQIRPLPAATAQDLKLNQDNIRKALLEGAQAAILAQEALRTIAEAATLPTFYTCPNCQTQVEHNPRTVNATQLKAAQFLINQIAGKPADRHQRILANQEYAQLTVQAITETVPSITRQQLEKIAHRILQLLGGN